MEGQIDNVGNNAEIEQLTPIRRFWVGLLLLIVSIILKYFVFSISVIVVPVYYLITFRWRSGLGQLGNWFYKMALANDQSGNVQNAVTFQLLFTKRKTDAIKYGHEDDTVSYITARNRYRGTLNFWGRALGRLLDAVDSSGGGHLYKSILSKIKADQNALVRIQEDKYFK